MEVTHEVSPPPYHPYHRWSLIGLTSFLSVCLLCGLGAWKFARVFYNGVDDSWPGDKSIAWVMLAGVLLLTLAWLIVLRGLPRFQFERRQPGYLAALGTVVASAFSFTICFAPINSYFLVRNSTQPLWQRVLITYIDTPTLGGLLPIAATVTGIWLTLMVSGMWQRAGGTLDRLGLFLGGSILLLYLIDCGLFLQLSLAG